MSILAARTKFSGPDIVRDGGAAGNIPKGLQHSARRWPVEPAYAGETDKMRSTLKGLYLRGTMRQPLQGCKMGGTVTQGSACRATLGWMI